MYENLWKEVAVAMLGLAGVATSQFSRVPDRGASEPRWAAQALYDAARGQVIGFGGVSATGLWNQKTTLWDGRNLSISTIPGSPSERKELAMAYDPIRARIVLFGGMDTQNAFGGADASSIHGEVWEISAPVDTGGPGRAIGRIPLHALSQPALGRTLRLWFQTYGVSSLDIGVGPSPRPVFTLPAPLFCTEASFYQMPLISLNLGTVPADGVGLPVPNSPSLLNGVLSLQGIALQPSSCLLATDSSNVRLINP